MKLSKDLIEGFHFYENCEYGLGSYFLDCLFSDIDSLLLYAGIHQTVFGYYRLLSKRFPFAIYYSVEHDLARVHAVLDVAEIQHGLEGDSNKWLHQSSCPNGIGLTRTRAVARLEGK